MSTIKPYQITYARIGTQESWSGWTVAGATINTPGEVINEFAALQGRNADNAGALYSVAEAKNVYEWIGKFGGNTGSYFHFTKMTFGILDDTEPPRTTMRSDSVVYSIIDHPEIIKNPYLLLSINKECFNNSLRLDSKRDENGKLKTSELFEEDAHTDYSLSEFKNDDSFNIFDEISRRFEDNKIYVNLIKCILWGLTFKSASSLYIVCDGDVNEHFKMFSLILCSIPYSFRNLVSFRTFSLTSSQPTTIVFTNSKPEGQRYFVLSNGENNVLTEVLTKKLDKHPFFTYFAINHASNSFISDFFEKLEKTMELLGDKTSIDPKFIDIAYDLIIEENDEDCEALSDKDYRNKLLKFLKIPYNNEVIDGYVAKLLETVLESGINLNEDIQKLIDDKLKVTKSEKLIKIGYSYRANTLLNNVQRDCSFSSLSKLKNNKELFPNIINAILLEDGGATFVDEFYGTFWGQKNIHNKEELLSFYNETLSLPEKKCINAFKRDMSIKIGISLFETIEEDAQEFSINYPLYVDFLRKIFPQNSEMVRYIQKKLRSDYWENFSLSTFSIDKMNLYKQIAFSESKKYIAIEKLSDIFIRIKKMSTNNVRSLRKWIKENKDLFILKERDYIRRYYQKCCVEYCDHTSNVDFWMCVSELSGPGQIEFLFSNNLLMFENEEVFEKEYATSEIFFENDTVDSMLNALDVYRRQTENKNVGMIYDLIRRLAKEKEKEKRNEAKAEKKTGGFLKNFSTRRERKEQEEIIQEIERQSSKELKHGAEKPHKRGFLGRKNSR